MQAPAPLSPAQLYQRCALDTLPFATTAELQPLAEIIGQDRATEAVQFAIGIRREGYNLFVMGPAGIGKRTLVRQFLEHEAARGATPSDWCYVNNFAQPHRPVALRLAPGQGAELRRDIDQLIDELRSVIPAAFESDAYRSRIQKIEDELKQRQESALQEIYEEAERNQIKLLRTPGGFSFAPAKDDEVISPEEFEQLPEQERERIGSTIARLQERLKKIIQLIPQWAKATREHIKALNREETIEAVGHSIAELKKRYQDLPDVLRHLDALQQDVIDNVDEFRKQEEAPQILAGMVETHAPSFRRYEVNVLVDQGEAQGLPIVYEDQPSYQNLVGRVEHLSQLGALVTDFTLIKSGALHRANGGYLILDAHKVLTQPYAWEGLKRALCSREIRIDSLGQLLSLISTVSLEPEPIPLDAKVILLGDRMLYYLLCELDPDFCELFKVNADFEGHMVRSDESQALFARLIGTLIQKEQLRAFDRGAVGRIIEYAARLSGDAQRLSMHMRSITDLVRETDYWAAHAGREVATAEDVQRAIDKQIKRHDRIRDDLLDEMLRGMLQIATSGERIGQINGMSVIDLGGFAFGHPTRISATARVGEGQVVDIEREVELGGAIHSKGVLILSSFLGERYSRTRPLSLSASLVFEQTYGGVEGDSASLAELCALLSALAELPLQQSLAMTGSVNQHGEVQAIGGVNEKIEGFFDLCTRRGLGGEHGMLIPASNVQHLMLRHDVVQAVQNGQFRIFPVRSVDEAMELLTGVPAGAREADGAFAEGSVNARVEDKLAEFSEIRHTFGESLKAGN